MAVQWAFMASEKNGVWGKVTSVSISASLAVGRTASLGTVACGSPGNCVTGGSAENFTHKGNFDKAFVAVQKNGQWTAATTVPGLKGLSQQGTNVESVSCARQSLHGRRCLRRSHGPQPGLRDQVTASHAAD